jgi:hypothetical protein
MMPNEAAERLYALFGSNVVLEADVNEEVQRIRREGAREAVERIRNALAGLTWPEIDWYNANDVRAILDEEAAR